MQSTLGQLWASLKPGGTLYVSFKQGTGERTANGRSFTDADEVTLRGWLESLPSLTNVECWQTDDARSASAGQWINALVTKQTMAVRKLIPGRSSPFLPRLCEAIAQASEIDIAVAFVKSTGLRLLLPDLHAAMGAREREADTNEQSARVRFLTSDYLGVTDPEALSLLLLLQQEGAHVRVYEAGAFSFHLKAYIFARFDDGGRLHGTAFVGSSNISRQALQDGLEWNYRISYPGDSGYLEARNRFEELFSDPQSVTLTDEWIRRYRQRRIVPTRPIAPGSHEIEAPPVPNQAQKEALDKLAATRREGYKRGLVVMATGSGKTWLAAFDSEEVQARRVLFVAHREEILHQAAETFLRVRPTASVGYYRAEQRDSNVDILCASIQTLGRKSHLGGFGRNHFDYIVIDEFHHASAPSYRRLLQHFEPQFLLGLTATPNRTDEADILSLCDDNLVFKFDLKEGIDSGLLVPFSYFGIFDDSVNYREIPWRNGHFDPTELTNKLATLARARHILANWREHRQKRTLAFCVSIAHAEFMAEQFQLAGVRSTAVHGRSSMSRAEALHLLREGQLEVVFSVDLFNEGVDLPEIDTVLLLRPTESKILFLQQLGRGLRHAPGKDRLVVADFIGNHHSFLHKPQALLNVGPTYRELADFARHLEGGRFALPEGCFVNFDLRWIDFLKSLDSDGPEREYQALKDYLLRRPTLLEFYRAVGSVQRVRQDFGSWFGFVEHQRDMEITIPAAASKFLRHIETTGMTKSFKMILLEAFQELDGWAAPPSLPELARQSWKVLQRRPDLRADIPDEFSNGESPAWQSYWQRNPVNAWIGGNTKGREAFFEIREGRFCPAFTAAFESFGDMVQEIVDFRLAGYASRTGPADNVIPINRHTRPGTLIPYFRNIPIACGHFRTGTADNEEFRSVGEGYGRLDPLKHFIARASGNSMDGGVNPVRDGDYLLLERISPGSAGGISNQTLVIERQDEAGDNQYLLRTVIKRGPNDYILRAANPAYADMEATEDFRTLARLRAIIPGWKMRIGDTMHREEIAGMFGVEFNPGSWNLGHVVLNEKRAHILLVTLSKRGKASEHRYRDQWIDELTFMWSSQNQTSPEDKRGREIIEHLARGITIHLFVRENKLAGGKAAPFLYHGPVEYLTHSGEKPMQVTFRLQESS
jgi:superfamily II DNA or RNA helicase/HKD family nuclease/SOS-response transcriptional repressor LexA